MEVSLPSGRILIETKRLLARMDDFFDPFLAELRTLQEAVADLRAKYARTQAPDLANMIRHGEAEIRDRSQPTRLTRSRKVKPDDGGISRSASAVVS